VDYHPILPYEGGHFYFPLLGHYHFLVTGYIKNRSEALLERAF